MSECSTSELRPALWLIIVCRVFSSRLQADRLYEKAAALALFNLRMKQALEILGNGADTQKGFN